LADTSAVTEVLVKTLNAYGMSGNQAIQVTDSISKAVELGNQEWSDYTSQLGRVASIAALAGVSLDEVNAFIASATKNGATAEIAFTGLGATLNTLLQPTKESQEAAAKLGLQWNYGALQAKGFAGLMAELAVATEKDKEATARLLGSQEAMRGAMAASSKGGTDFKNILEQLGNAAGKTDTDFQTMKGSLENTLKALDTSFKNLSESLGKAFGPTLVIVIQDITKAVNGFANVMNAIPQPVMNAVGGLAKFVVQMLLVQKAIQAIIALRAAYVAAMAGMAAATVASGAAATTSAGAFALYTSNARTLQAASILATGSVSGLAGALLALAGIGIVTVGVNYVVTQVGDIIGSSTAAGKSVTAGTKAGLQAQLKGKSEADRKKMLATAQKNLQNDKKLASQLQLQIQRQDNLASSAGEGALPSERSKLTQIQARINTNQARIKAIQTLPITQATPPKPQLPPPTGAIPPADGGGGAGAKPKEKEIKAAKQILDISKEESTLRAQLALYTAQEDLYAQALLTKELAIFKAKQDQIGPNERKLQMFEAEVTYVKTINDLEKEKTDKLKSQNELNQQKMQPLQDELAIMQARLAGNEAEVMLRIQIRDIMAGTAGLAQQDVADTLNQINATKQLLTEKEKIANLVQNIGSSIESGIVGAIDGAITGAKSLQESLADVLKDIGRMLISFGIKSLLGGIDIGGTKIFGGGRAAGGPVSSNSTYMVGEKGPELFVPSSSGTIIPADATAAAMARYQRQGSGSGVSGSGSDAMGAGEATPVLSMSFETTRFMDRDWVDKDQLVAAMAATERRATTAGAKAGAAQVSSQMRNSPGYRRQVGLR
jgi:TP901 family phage tail tape measure protein